VAGTARRRPGFARCSDLNRKSSLGHAYAVAGRTAEARKVLADLGKAATESYVPAYWFALERAFEERSGFVAGERSCPPAAQRRTIGSGAPRGGSLGARHYLTYRSSPTHEWRAL
jgi:hypothetical protein